MAIFSSFASLFSGQPSSSKSPADEPTLAQAAHNRTKSKGKMALVRQDSDVYTKGRPYNVPLADDFSSRVSLQVNGGAGGPGGGLAGGDISRPGSPAAPGSAFLGSNRSPTPPPQNGSFSYPPRAPATYSHLAGNSNSPALQSGSPTVYRPAAPHAHAAYPPLHTTWSRLRSFLGSTYPDLEDSLNLPAPAEVINELELRLNMPLPSSVRESYLCADGQDVDGGRTEGLFFGLALLPLEDVLSEWTFWRSVEADPATGANPRLNATMGSYPQRFIKKLYVSRGWLPLISDRAGNYIGVDLDPGPKGEWGQVIIWGRDFDNKCVLWRGEGEGGWGRWFESWITDLENGEGWELEDTNESTGSEDDVGYSTYFHDPTSGRSGGDVYGDGSGGLRMTGEYRGWAVLEAVWDKSVKQWDAAGLLKVKAGEEDEFGVEKDSAGGGAGGLGLGVGDVGKKGGLVEIEGGADGQVAEEGGFIGDDKGKRLLVSTLPSTNTGIYPADEQADARLLSPPSATSSSSAPLLTTAATRAANNHARTTSNAPEPFDLPTRTDVIAAEAVALAEGKNLRGGWVMSGLLPERGDASASTAGAVDLEAGPVAPFTDKEYDDRPPGSGTLSPPNGGVLGFLSRRGSAESKLPQELPLPMSLPPSPAPRTFSPPLPAGTSTDALPPPARVKSPLSNPANPVELGPPVTAPAVVAEDQVGDDSFGDAQPTIHLVRQQAQAGSDDNDDGELMDVSLGADGIDAPTAQDDDAGKKGKLRSVFGSKKT